MLHQSLVSPNPVPTSQEAPQLHMVVHLQLWGVVVSESATSCEPENHLKSMFRSDNSLVSSSRVKGHAAKIFTVKHCTLYIFIVICKSLELHLELCGWMVLPWPRVIIKQTTNEGNRIFIFMVCQGYATEWNFLRTMKSYSKLLSKTVVMERM